MTSIAAVRPAEPTQLVVVIDQTAHDYHDDRPLLEKLEPSDPSEKSDTISDNSTVAQGPSWVPTWTKSFVAAHLERLTGVGYIVFGGLNISLMSTCIKFATHHVTSHEAVFWRSLLSFFFNLMLVRHHKVSLVIASEHRVLLFLRCLLGTMAICFQFYAVSRLVLMDAVVIIFTSPVITFILGAIFLHEVIDKIDFIAAILSYGGVIFVTRPAFLFPATIASSSPTRSDGIAASLAAACCQACAYIVVRKLHDVHHMASIHYFSLFGIGFSLVMLAVFHVPLVIPDLWSVRLALVAASFFACVGQLSLTIGFQREQAGIASVMRYFDVIFVLIWDTIFLGEHIHGYTLLGGGIILLGASVIAYRKAHEVPKPQDITKK